MLLVPEISQTEKRITIIETGTTAFKCLHFAEGQFENPERSLQGVTHWSFQRQRLLFGVYLLCGAMQKEAWRALSQCFRLSGISINGLCCSIYMLL